MTRTTWGAPVLFAEMVYRDLFRFGFAEFNVL